MDLTNLACVLWDRRAEFGEEVSVKYSAYVLATGQLVVEDEKREFRIGDGEVMPGTVARLMKVFEASHLC